MKNRRLRISIIIAVIILIPLIGARLFYLRVESNLKNLASAPVAAVNLDSVPDGAWTGRHKVFPIDVEVLVTVKDHAITDVKLVKHFNGQGGAAEKAPAEVVRRQSLAVDAVGGATYSSKVILLAIRNALAGEAR